MTFKIKRCYWQAIDIERDDLMTLTEAAQAMDMTLPGVIAAMNRGRLSEIINEDAPSPQRERRLALRSDVELELLRRDKKQIQSEQQSRVGDNVKA